VIVLAAGTSKSKKPAVLPDPLQEQREHQRYSGLLGITFFVLLLSIAIIYLWQPYQPTVL
jgi:hypothetical protein